MLPKESCYVKYIKGLEILVGKFSWYGDVMTDPNQDPPAQPGAHPGVQDPLA